MSLDRPQLGAIPIDASRTRFTIWAPLHERLRIRFPDRERVEVMGPCGNGYHVLETQAPPGTLYRIQFADGRLRPDPASRAQPQGVHGPSMVMRVGGEGPVERFACPSLRHHVLYELHVGTFTAEGTFDAIVPRLPALRELGVTGIELMPIGQFPGERNWGYDGVCLFAAQWSYGGLPGLLGLVDACHRHGMAIFLDVVYNHLGPEGNYLAEFGPYFTDRYKTPWGPALNFDGPDSDAVREFFIQSSLHWTRDCGIDGLRLDAVHAIVDHTAAPFVEALAARNHAEGERQGRRVLIIAESGDNDPRLVRPRAAGGMGLDACWNDDYHHAIRSVLTGERRGYYQPFGRTDQIAKAIRDRYVFAGEYSSGLRRRHGGAARDLEHERFVVFTQNHDQVGNRPLGERLDAIAGLDGARAAATLVLLSPFAPLLWMGEEYGETAPFQYFVSHLDPALVEAVRRGRKEEFAAFQQAGEIPDPQSEETFRRSKLDWSLRNQGIHARTLAFYKELLRLRRQWVVPASTAGASAEAQEKAVLLRYEDPMMLVVANLGEQVVNVRTWDASRGASPAWRMALDSDDVRWGGQGRNPRECSGSGREALRIEGRSAMVLALEGATV